MVELEDLRDRLEREKAKYRLRMRSARLSSIVAFVAWIESRGGLNAIPPTALLDRYFDFVDAERPHELLKRTIAKIRYLKYMERYRRSVNRQKAKRIRKENAKAPEREAGMRFGSKRGLNRGARLGRYSIKGSKFGKGG